jgi:DNA-binding beta-propeller fold protein YncE
MMKLFKNKWWKRVSLGLLGLTIAFIIYGLLQLIEPIAIAPAEGQFTQFSGDALVVASDADMVATAYADAKLDRVVGIKDTLTILGLPLTSDNIQKSEIKVSNSVQSWPHILAVSPDRTKVYVAEVRGRPADGIQEFESIEQMPAGNKVSVVDITNVERPKVLQTLAVGTNPIHLSISPNGRFLAVNLLEKGKNLALIKIQANGLLGKINYFSVLENAFKSLNEAVTWHRSGKFLAFTTASDGTDGSVVAFYEVLLDGDENIRIQPYGDPIKAGNHLSMGKFTPDGKLFLVPDLKWRVYGRSLLSFLMNPQGELIAIQLNEQQRQPKIVSRTEVGLSPEGLTISPDGKLAITVNMRRTYLPNWLPAWRGRDRNSLSLVAIEPNSGKLTQIDEYGFEGLLPEDIVFDAEGKSLAVVIFHDRIRAPKTGKVEFWNVLEGSKLKLERTNFKLSVTRGAHTMMLVK